jgi:hypothetical protein
MSDYDGTHMCDFFLFADNNPVSLPFFIFLKRHPLPMVAALHVL